jgi:hypothetical protein
MSAWLIAFAAMVLTDFFWVLTVRSVRDDRPLASGVWAIFLFLTAAVGTISYITDHWLLVPAAAGTFLGTVLGVLWNRKSK